MRPRITLFLLPLLINTLFFARQAVAQTANAGGTAQYTDGRPADGMYLCVVKAKNKEAYEKARRDGTLHHRKEGRNVTYCLKHVKVTPKGTFELGGLQDDGWYYLYPRESQQFEQANLPPLARVEVDNHQNVTLDVDPKPIIFRILQQPQTGRGRGRRPRSAAVLVMYLKPAQDKTEQGGKKEEAQAQYVLAGRITDPQNQPLTGVAIILSVARIKVPGFDVIGKGLTDQNGSFSIAFEKKQYQSNIYFTASLANYRTFDSVVSLDGKDAPKILPDGNNIVLTPSEVVLVTSNQPMTVTTEASRRYVFHPEQMQALPLAGARSFDAFALLAPGVLPPPQTASDSGPGVSSGVGTPGQFSVNGLRSRENNFTVDGSDNNDEDIGTRRQGFVNLAPQTVESLGEFQIVTALPDARFGRNLGGQVDALTKSGSDHFHGSLYGFYSSDRLNAKDFFDQTARGGPPSFTLTRAEDGAPVLLDGKPITLQNPTRGKNRFMRRQEGMSLGGPVSLLTDAYFFTSFERIRTRADRESHFAVPTVAQRGLFGTGATGLLNTGGGPVPGNHPLFPTTIPGDAIFSLYPFPNNPLGPYGQNTYTEVLPADADGVRILGKMQKQFGEPDPDRGFRWRNLLWVASGDSFSGRYNFTQERSTLPVTGGALFSSLRPFVRTQNMAFFLNRNLTGTLSDTIRFSFGRTRLVFDEVRDPFLSASTFFPKQPFLLNAPLLLNVTAPNADGTLNPATYVSATSPQGAALLNSLGYSSVTSTEQIAGPLGQVIIPGFSPVGVDVNSFPQSRANNTFQIADTVTYIRSGNLFTFGFDVRRPQINSTLDRGFRPLAVFDGLRDSREELFGPGAARPDGAPLRQTPDFSGSTLAAAGLPTGLFQTLSPEPNSTIGIRFSQVNFFFQDEFRLRSNLRVTLGARYELNTVPHTVNRRLENAFNPAEFQTSVNDAIRDCQRIALFPQRCDDIAREFNAVSPSDFRVTFGSDKTDFKVRAGFAWDVFNDSKTVLRGGFGSYTGQYNGFVLGQSRDAFPDFLPLNFASGSDLFSGGRFLFNVANPILQQAEPGLSGIIVPGTLNAMPPGNPVSFLVNGLPGHVLGLDLVLPQSKLTTPYSYHYAITLERQFGRNYLASVAYVGTRGVGLLRVATPEQGVNRSAFRQLGNQIVFIIDALNPTLPFPTVSGELDGPAQQGVIARALTVAPTVFESSASSTYNSMQAEVRRRYRHGVQFGTALTYSHSIDDASDYLDTASEFALPQNSLLRSERGPSAFDVRLRWVTNFVFDLPGRWQVAGIVTAQTGQPFTVNSAFDINRDGNLTDRLNRTNGLIVTERGPTQLRLAPGASPSDLLAPDESDGAVGRNTFRAPGVFTFDTSLSKALPVTEHQRLLLRVEAFNLFNRTNFGIPVRILEAPAFGASVYTTVPARTIRLAFKYQF